MPLTRYILHYIIVSVGKWPPSCGLDVKNNGFVIFLIYWITIELSEDEIVTGFYVNNSYLW